MLPSRQCNIRSIKAFSGIDCTFPISTFLRSPNLQLVTLSDFQRRKTLDIGALREKVKEFHHIVSESIQENEEHIRKLRFRGKLQNFIDDDFILVARKEFLAYEKLCLR